MRPVKGACYHDHRWGSAELNRVFSQDTVIGRIDRVLADLEPVHG